MVAGCEPDAYYHRPPPHSLPVSPSLRLLRLFELSVDAYSQPRGRDPLPPGTSGENLTSISLGASPGSENSTNDPSYPRWCTNLFQEPSGSLSLPPCVLGTVWSSPPSIEISALAVSASAAAPSTGVLESILLSVSLVGWVPTSLRSWLSHLTPLRVDHLKTACSSSGGHHARICLSCPRGFAGPFSIVFVPIP